MAGLLAVRRGAMAMAMALVLALAPVAVAQFRDTIPEQQYFTGVESLYSGDYRQAQRIFQRSFTGGIKTVGPNGPIRWVDSICYHAMLGETLFQWGRPEAALEQFNFACQLYLQYPNWMMQVDFQAPPRVDSTLARSRPPWGTSARQFVPGNFTGPYNVAMGQLDNSNVARFGGVVQQAQYWPVNVAEILRSTTLAIRRRNELLGPLGPFDPLSKRLVLQLARGGAPPNHWSGAWVSVARGLAHAGVGETQQALRALSSGLIVAGQFDHPLTCVALLEQGRLAMEDGNVESAADLLAEAGYSAFLYGDGGVLDDSIRWGQQCRVLAAPGERPPTPALAAAAEWARRRRLEHVAARLNLAIADEQLAARNGKAALAALAVAQSLLGDARTGVLGNEAAYLAAVLECQAGRGSGPARLADAVQGRAAISLTNFQLRLANSMFDAQTLPTRSAEAVYGTLLSDPTAADSTSRPLDAMAVMITPHGEAFDRWLTAALQRRDIGAAIEVTDRAKRRRFHAAQPLGGRLGAVRDLLCSPLELLSPAAQQQRNDVLLRWPDVREAIDAAAALRSELASAWTVAPDKDQQRAHATLWQKYSAALDDREDAVRQAALDRAPAVISFPPLTPADEIQASLKPGQALLVYQDTSDGLLGFMVTSQAATTWNCGPSGEIAALATNMLRDLGNYDANREMTTDELASHDWHASSEKIYRALFEGSSLGPEALNELIVIPDGVAWYVPFEALWIKSSERAGPLISFAKVRYAPTAALAFKFQGPWRRMQRIGLLSGELVPGETDEARLAAIEPLEAAIPGMRRLERQFIAPSPVVASLLDAAIVLDDVETERPNPFDWSPLPIDRAPQQGSLDQWLTVARMGPQRIILPGMHTLAERGGRASRRRGVAAPLGDELFFASCTLMNAGAETLLLSRWRVGGQSTLELVREFIKEASEAAAADAWQRSVQLSMEMPVDPSSELRVTQGKKVTELTASHPFFWASYMVVDSGWTPPEPEPAPDQTKPAADAVAAPAEAPAQQAGNAADRAHSPIQKGTPSTDPVMATEQNKDSTQSPADDKAPPSTPPFPK